MIRLIVADDHVVMREGLVALLKDEPDLRVVGQAGNGPEALTLIRQQRPDVALLDITMPEMSGLEVASQCAAYLPRLKILFLTMHEEDAFFFAALRVGAAGYVLKGAASGELLGAIRAVHAGGIYLTPKLAGGLVHDYLDRHPASSPHDLLTLREREVLALIGAASENQEIAKTLGVSEQTARNYVHNLYSKLGVSNRTQLQKLMARLGPLAP